MKSLIKCFIILCTLAVCFFVLPTASADDWNRKTIVTFSAPVEVPGVGAQVLPAGTYVFKILDSLSDRHIVQIFNKDQTHVFTTILAIPNYRLRATDKTVITFKERAQGEPEAIRAWFYPGHQWGEEFVYDKTKALDLAKVANEPPTGEAVPVAQVVQAPPVETAKMEAATLPATASNLPLLALAGLLSLGAAGVITKFTA
jgi:hypothetical protein